MARAVFNGAVVAESDQVVTIEGVAYFPPESVDWSLLEETATRTGCPWRGVATYYTVQAAGLSEADAAWSYQTPKRKARRIAGWVAFWKRVTVDGVESVDGGTLR